MSCVNVNLSLLEVQEINENENENEIHSDNVGIEYIVTFSPLAR